MPTPPALATSSPGDILRSTFLVGLIWSVVGCTSTPAAAPSSPAQASIVLNGQPTRVRWSDGDSFKLLDGPFARKGTRLQGYNALESYGPVHRWGDWTAKELFKLAKSSASVAAAEAWQCTTDGQEDHYRRILVDCPELTRHMVRQGHGFVYYVDGEAPPALLALQREAQAAKVGMWAKGAPKGVVSSVHSADEEGAAPYNRLVDLRTGQATPRPHSQRYETCQEVCEETDGDTSCLVYVPFSRRYRNPAGCLR